MPENWDQVKEIVASALEMEPEQRSSFVRGACASDPSLLAEVESLLSNFNSADSILERPITDDDVFRPSAEMVGKQIGSYRIIREAGHGGMAVVYLAERADRQFRKRVAIKMVRPGPDNQRVLARFRNERQTLAALDHPNIVKLLDGGASEEGFPYLVMDYVEGVAIAQYCDENRLSVTERLRLFQAVCAAVQYAHENGVIHRDLKPANILVTREGVPRLLDFGISKLLNPECLENELVTQTNWRPMTPEYASPEQVRGEKVTVLSDVYSLGVVLYELLTGHKPYQVSRRSWPQIEHLICETDPESVSTVVSRTEEATSNDGRTLTVTPELVSKLRRTTPNELCRCLRGDLNTIVMKALFKDPGQRYGSAAALAGDIDSYLSGLPIRARRPTVFYRTEKFVRRHTESIAAVTIALVLMATVGGWQARRLWKQNAPGRTSGTVHIRARPSLAVLGFKNLSGRSDTAWLSTSLTEILTSELSAGEQLRIVPGESVSRTKIDLGLSDVESITPNALGQVRRNLGSDFIIIGSYLDPGGENSRIRLDLRLQDAVKGETVATFSETGAEVAIIELALRVGSRIRDQFSLHKLSQIESASINAELPSTPEAMRLFSEGLARIRSFDALGARELLSRAAGVEPSFALGHSALATAWSSLGYDSKAVQESKKALDLASNLSREKHLVVEAAYEEASKNWTKAIEAYQTLFSFFPDNVEYGLNLARAQALGGKGNDALNTLASLVSSGIAATDDPRVDLAKAEAGSSLGDDKLRRDAAHTAAAQAGKQGARLLQARARALECRALANLGENEDAKPVCEEARQIYSEVGDRAGLARTLHAMAEIPINQGDLGSAKKLYEEALSLARTIGNQQAIGRELLNLGVIYKAQGDFSRTRQLYDAALRSYKSAGDVNGMMITNGNTANLLSAQGRLVEALARYKSVLALSQQVGNTSSAALAMENMADLLAEQGDLAEALPLAQQSADKFRDGGQKHYYAGALVVVGYIFEQQGQPDKAQKAFNEARSLQDELGEKGPAAKTELAIAELNCDTEQSEQAQAEILAAIPQFRVAKDIDNQSLANTLLSRALLQQGKLDEAQQAIASALELSQKSAYMAVRLAAEIQDAHVRIAVGDLTRAEQSAQAALARASRLGFLRLQFEAALALAEAQIKHGNLAAGRARLHALEKVVRSKGFLVLADRAAAAAKS